MKIKKWMGWLAIWLGVGSATGCAPVLFPAAVGDRPPGPQELTVWIGDDPGALDPALADRRWTADLLNSLGEGLMRLDSRLIPQPALAERVEVSDDRKEYVFRLRDVRWSDGRPLTADDFRFAWLRVLRPETRSASAPLFFGIRGAEEFHAGRAGPEAVGIEVPDPKSLKVILKSPAPDFPSLTCLPPFFPLPRALADSSAPAPGSGTGGFPSVGPFRLAAWERGRKIVAEKNERYWDANRVHLRKVTFRIVRDPQERLSLYESGELDQTGVEEVATTRLDLVRSPEAAVFFLVFDGEAYPPFRNKKIRQAFAYALDRKAYVKAIWKEGAEPAYGFVPPGIPGLLRTFREENGDLFGDGSPDPARRLLQEGMAELGLASLPPPVFAAGGGPAKKSAEILRDQWKDLLGVDVRVETVPEEALRSGRRPAGAALWLAGWGADSPDAAGFLRLWVSRDSNPSGYSSDLLSGLLESAQGQTDAAARIRILRRAERALAEDMPAAPLFFRRKTWLQKPYVRGIVYLPAGPDWDLKEAYLYGR